MAGGKGTRLQQLNNEIPKPMFRILDKPILEYQIESLKKSGICDITLVIGYLGDAIRDYFKDGSEFGVNIDYITEDVPLGTAGALYYLKDKIDEDFVLVFGDLIFDVDFNRFMDFHKRHGAFITLYGHPNAHPYDSDVINVDENSCITGILSKKLERTDYYHNFVNAGIYCVNPKLLNMLKEPVKTDLEKDLVAGAIKESTAYAYRSTEYVKDMGTPDRLEAVELDIKSGTVTDRSLRNKQKAIFLDRDGTINVLKGFLKNADEFELIDDVAAAISLINKSGYLAIIATNQPVVARGECTFGELERIHMKMETLLGEKGAYLDDVYFCPHHPNSGFQGEIKELKIKCECRKPGIGMLTKASEEYNIDLTESWYIGDTTMDVKTGLNAGMKTVLLHTGEAGKDGKFDVMPTFEADTLLEAVSQVLKCK